MSKNIDKKKKKATKTGKKNPYLFLIPAFIAILCLQVLPLIEAIYMSLLNVKGSTMREFFTTFRAPFVGLKNYLYVITGSNGNMMTSFHTSITKTLSYVLIANILTLTAAVIIALALNRKFKFSGIARSLLLLPFIMPGFVIETAWLTLLSKNDGFVNQILVDLFHLMPNKIDWFSGERVFWVVVLITVWHYFPLFAIFLLAGLQNIPRECYEAADIDGAGHFRKFTHITLPLLRPVLAILIFIGTIINTYDSYKLLGTEFYSEAGWSFIMDYFRYSYFTPWMYGFGTAGTIMVMICVIIFVFLWYLYFKKDFNSALQETTTSETEKRRRKLFDKIAVFLSKVSGSVISTANSVNMKFGITNKTRIIKDGLVKLHIRLTRFDYLSLLFWPVLILIGFKHLTSNIGREGFWYDESYSASIINHSFSSILDITAGDSHPPLYFMLLKIFSMVFGNTESSLRMFSVLGVLALALLGAGPVKRAFDKFTGVIFALVVTIVPMSLSMAQDTRMYTWAAFFVTGAVLYGYLSARDGRISDFIKLALFSVASAYIHYYALLAVTIANIILFIYFIKIKDKKRLNAYLITAAASVVCYIPWILILASQISRVSKNFWILSVNVYVIWQALLFPFTAKFDSGYPFIIPSFIGTVIFIVAGFWYSIKRRDKKGILSAYAISVYILTLVTAVVVSYLVRPIFVTRYIYPVVGLFLLVVSYGISRLKYRDFSIFAVLILLVFSLVPYSQINKEYYNGPIKEIKYYMGENIKQDDIFIHADEHSFGIFSYYYPDHEHFLYLQEEFLGYSGYKAFEPVGRTGSDISSFIEGHENMWLVGRVGGSSWSGIYPYFNSGILSYKDKNKVFHVESSGFRYVARRVYQGNGSPDNECAKGKITLKFGGVRSKPGPMVIKIFNRDVPIVEENSNKIIEENVYITKSVDVVNGEVEVVLEDMPMGEYLAIAFHDENNNGIHDWDMDKEVFEGYGITGNFIYEKPRFQLNKFSLDYFETETLISISYPEDYRR